MQHHRPLHLAQEDPLPPSGVRGMQAVVGRGVPARSAAPPGGFLTFLDPTAPKGLRVLLQALSSHWPNPEENFGVPHGTTSSFLWGFPGGSDGKESACSVEDPSSIPGSGRSPGGGDGNPLQYSCLENPMDRGAWRAAVHGLAKSQTRLSDTHTHTHTHTRGVGKGTSSMRGGSWTLGGVGSGGPRGGEGRPGVSHTNT